MLIFNMRAALSFFVTAAAQQPQATGRGSLVDGPNLSRPDRACHGASANWVGIHDAPRFKCAAKWSLERSCGLVIDVVHSLMQACVYSVTVQQSARALCVRHLDASSSIAEWPYTNLI
jgi:hypothetical protein